MNKIYLGAIIFLVIVVLSACLAGPNPMEKKSNEEGKVAGFWKGLWHGFIAPVTFIISIFSSKVRFYEVYNNGFWYNFGFVLAAGLFLTGGILGRGKKKKKK
ncbi:MAG: hypothetical protein KAT17_07910 [Candidatus Aminicenantes bacterium]|nr:hypothetical protein [Candidatus Aminicenantes bacterium]